MPSSIFVFLFAIASTGVGLPVRASKCFSLSVDTTEPIFVTDPNFASWTIDPSRNRAFFDVNYSDPRILYLVSQIGNGGVIRFGGGGADLLTYGVNGLACDDPRPPPPFECLNKTTLDSVLTVAAAASARCLQRSFSGQLNAAAFPAQCG